jgi:hypothetical protein
MGECDWKAGKASSTSSTNAVLIGFSSDTSEIAHEVDKLIEAWWEAG